MNKLENKFGKMNLTYGNKQMYLDVEIFIVDKKVLNIMKVCLLESIAVYGEPINSSAKSPSRRNLLVVDEEAEMLDDHKKVIFHKYIHSMIDKPRFLFIRNFLRCPFMYMLHTYLTLMPEDMQEAVWSSETERCTRVVIYSI